MSDAILTAWGQVGAAAALTLAAAGSAMGTGAAGAAAVGAWKRCYIGNKQAPFQLAIFVGAPLSQTIYGLILMIFMMGYAADNPSNAPVYCIAGIFGGIAMGFSAWMQGRAGAGASDAFAETGKGFTNYLLALGVIETVALFVMAFLLVFLPKG